MFIFDFLLKPKTEDIRLRFREQTIRVVVFIPLLFFLFLLVLDILSTNLFQIEWYIFIFCLIGLIYALLHYNQVNNAGRALMVGLFLIILDPTAAYWSPGTVIFGLLFTFMTQITLESVPEQILAELINLGIYTYLALSAGQPSPLDPNDYFADPLLAVLTVYVAHIMLIGVAIIIRQQQRSIDENRIKIEQNRADLLQQFLGFASHDLRTMMARLSSAIYLARMRLPEEHHHAIDKLEIPANDLENLLLSMLEMAQLSEEKKLTMQDGQFDWVCNALCEKYQPLARAKSQQFELINNAPDLKLKMDQEYLQRAIGNIIQNAINYTPENGTIKMEANHMQSKLLVKVSDTGIGISTEQLPHIFDSFYRGDQARNQTTGLNGLGLAISRKIIELHAGKIKVESEVGVGSTFLITLPID